MYVVNVEVPISTSQHQSRLLGKSGNSDNVRNAGTRHRHGCPSTRLCQSVCHLGWKVCHSFTKVAHPPCFTLPTLALRCNFCHRACRTLTLVKLEYVNGFGV